MTVLCTFEDGTVITRENNFDDWFIKVNGKGRYDRDYLTDLANLANKYDKNKVYNDFVTVYNNTHFSVNNDVFQTIIPNIANTYDTADNLAVRKLFSELYAVMLAEQNRFYDGRVIPAKKKIKRLAVHQLLFFNFTVEQACSYSRESKEFFVRELHRIICSRGQNNAYCQPQQQDLSDCKYNIFNRGQLIVQICHVFGF